MRLIDADDFKKFIEKLTELGAPYDEIIKLLDQQPTVEIPSFNKLLQDGTLVVNTDLYFEVSRVLIEHETNGTLYYSDGDERPKGKWIKVPYKVCDCEDSYYTMHGCSIAKDYNFNNLTKEEKENCPFTNTLYKIVCDNCGIEKPSNYDKYCPNCGAEMEIGE